MGVRLPAEYQEVDFLESTGTQYIVLPISNITKTDEFELVVQRLNNKNTSCFGYSANGKYYDINLRQDSSQHPAEIAWGGTGIYIRSTSELLNDRFYKISLRLNDSNKLIGSIDGNPMSRSITPSEASLNAPLRLFGRSGANYYAITRCKSFRYWRDSAVSCNIISCYRKSDNKPGMYDLVSGEFFINQGTGEFLVGPDVIDSISPWLVARRRMLMRKPPLDTSPRIAEYGVYLNRSASGTAVDSSWCYTDWYDIDPHPSNNNIIDNVTNSNHTFQFVKSGGSGDYWYGSSRNLAGEPIKIRFSMTIAMLNGETEYAYSSTTGQIFFAGRNTPYYGYTNINDMPQG